MTVPGREHLLEQLMERLERPLILSMDEERHGPWWNARHAWTDYPAGVTHHTVLHDDALPCFNFEAEVERILEVWPSDPLCFYTTRIEAYDCRPGGALDVVGFAWGAGLCLPVGLIEEFVGWCDTHTRGDWIADDTRMMLWIAATGRRLVCPIPSIVDHNPEGHSTVSNQGNDTSSAAWYTEHASDVTWGGRPEIKIHHDRRQLLIGRTKRLKGDPRAKITI